MKVINEGIPTKLKFGKNRDLELITISSINTTCNENFEIAREILIQNGEIIDSECETQQVLVLNTFRPLNIPKMIVINGKYFLFYLNTSALKKILGIFAKRKLFFIIRIECFQFLREILTKIKKLGWHFIVTYFGQFKIFRTSDDIGQ